MTVTESAEVVVVGMGPGGEAVANGLAEAGVDVVGIDHQLVGGECPYWGCIPSKMMIRAANLLAEARRVPGMAGAATVDPSWEPVAARIREATDNWDDRAAVERFEGKGGRFVRGAARLDGPGRVTVDGHSIEASRGIVLATGTSAVIPPIPGLAETAYWTNREAIETKVAPESLIVLGGGAIGLELAQMFARFGTKVSVVEAAGRLLSVEEPEASELIGEVLGREGVEVRVGVSARSVEQRGSAVRVRLDDGSDVRGQHLLVATGRKAAVKELNLSSAAIDDNARWISVDDRMRAVPGVWAVGDVTGKGAFTHVAMYQAGIALKDILGLPGPPADYRATPRVTFTDPEIGAVGLTAEAARREGLDVRTADVRLSEAARGWIHKAGGDGFIKLVQDRVTGLLVGATSAGPCGGEVLAALTVAVHARVPLDALASMIYAYPTFHRAIEPALEKLS